MSCFSEYRIFTIACNLYVCPCFTVQGIGSNKIKYFETEKADFYYVDNDTISRAQLNADIFSVLI